MCGSDCCWLLSKLSPLHTPAAFVLALNQGLTMLGECSTTTPMLFFWSSRSAGGRAPRAPRVLGERSTTPLTFHSKFKNHHFLMFSREPEHALRIQSLPITQDGLSHFRVFYGAPG